MKYTITYKIEGQVTVSADSEEEARDNFYDLSDAEIMNNSFLGAEISDIRKE